MAKAIVIGAGFGGIAVALRLRRKGYAVTLIDKQDKLGGRAYQYRRETPLGTFVHDAGPTVITAKFLFDELFEMFGKKREDYVEFRDIYPWYRIVFAGEIIRKGCNRGTGVPSVFAAQAARILTSDDANTGETPVPQLPTPAELPYFDYGGTLEQFEAQIAKFEPADVEGFRRYLKHSKNIFDVGFTKLGDQPFDQFTTMLRCAPALMRLQNYKTVYGMAKKYIKNEKLRRVFSFQPLLVGGNPFNTTSIYSLIFYLEREWGIQFAMGGTGAIVRGLEKLMREEGIEIRLGEEATPTVQGTKRMGPVDVQKVRGDPKPFSEMNDDERQALFDQMAKSVVNAPTVVRVTDVETSSGWKESVNGWRDGDVVVCNADAPDVYERFIDPEHRHGPAAKRMNRKSKAAGLKFSMGLFVLYFGTTKTYPDIAHHTIVLGEGYREVIDRLFDTDDLEREDLSVYLHRPTATDPSMAPPGCESFYVLVPVPNLQPGKKQSKRSKTSQSPCPAGHGLEGFTRADGTIDWTKMGRTFRDDVVRYLERTILPGLSECIVDDFYVTPEHFEKNLNSMHGAGFSIQPIFSQSAWFRFHNKAPGIEGLYFVGAGTHPGAGMPGVLCSAKVLEHLIPDVPVGSPGTPGEC